MKSGVDTQSQTKVSPETKQKIQYLSLELIFKAKLKIESENQKNPIWPPGGHFEINIAENQSAPTHIHKYCAT